MKTTLRQIVDTPDKLWNALYNGSLTPELMVENNVTAQALTSGGYGCILLEWSEDTCKYIFDKIHDPEAVIADFTADNCPEILWRELCAKIDCTPEDNHPKHIYQIITDNYEAVLCLEGDYQTT